MMMTKTKTVAKGKAAETLLRADRNLLVRMIIIAKGRNLQMQDVLNYPDPRPSSCFPHLHQWLISPQYQ